MVPKIGDKNIRGSVDDHNTRYFDERRMCIKTFNAFLIIGYILCHLALDQEI